jgi:hypothetical protein
VEPTGREARIEDRLVDLTRLKFDLLDALSDRPRVAFSRRQLLERVWARDGTATSTSWMYTWPTCGASSATTCSAHATYASPDCPILLEIDRATRPESQAASQA